MQKIIPKPMEKQIILLWRAILVVSLSVFLVTAIRFASAIENKPEPKGTESSSNVQEEMLGDLLETEVLNEMLENKHVEVRNAGTNHVFLVEEAMEAEKRPDLSTSTLKGKIGEDGIIRYTMVLKNTGNTHATDIDVFNELDTQLGMPEKFTFSNCGGKTVNSSEEGVVDLSNILVEQGKNCTIHYQASVSGVGEIVNALYISPAMEGGEEVGPIEEILIFESSSPAETAPVIESPEEITDSKNTAEPAVAAGHGLPEGGDAKVVPNLEPVIEEATDETPVEKVK